MGENCGQNLSGKDKFLFMFPQWLLRESSVYKPYEIMTAERQNGVVFARGGWKEASN